MIRNMIIFKTLDEKINYKDIIQLDAAFAVAHINYGESPIFNKISGKDIENNSRKKGRSSKKSIENVIDCINFSNGTEQNLKKEDRILLWENYWLEYINAFDNIIKLLPSSVVTVYIGRHAIEVGIKYLLLKKTGQIKYEHNLGVLSNLLFTEYNIKDEYMKWVNEFCSIFCEYIEGKNVEYFRYPEYKNNTFFAGNCLDIKWIIYNLSLIILKLIHFANLDSKFK
jgi:hypothetical protein